LQPGGEDPAPPGNLNNQRGKSMTTKKQIPVLVTTQHRGVFFGFVPADQDMTARTMRIADARCAIRWATTRGVAELAEIGPNENTKIGACATLAALHDITAVWECTQEAVKQWTR